MEELNLQEIQQGSLFVLKRIKEICEEQNIKFFLMYGTLIGAVRHQGFIPWDDDIDIMMPRPDYERFIQYCIDNKEKLGYFKLKHYRTCKEYIYGIARFCDTRYKIDYDNARDYGLGLFVDIYPIDGINPIDKKWMKKIRHKQSLIWQMGTEKYTYHNGIIKTVLKYPVYLCYRANFSRFLKKLDEMAQKYKYEESEFVGCPAWFPQQCPIYIKKEDIKELALVKFEDTAMYIPKQYDNILRLHYNDYMQLPPENERAGHHNYKAYRLR